MTILAENVALARIAVLPVEDLRIGSGNVNWEMTARLERHLRQKGIESVPSQELLDFFAQNRIRRVGHLTLAEIVLAGKTLACSHLAVASLTQLDEAGLSFGMTIHFLRTADGKVVWTSTSAASPEEMQSLLGINAPDGMLPLVDAGLEQLLAGMPGLETKESPMAATSPRQFLVDSVHLSPTHIKPGETVRCTVRFNPLAPLPEKVMFKVGSTVHLAERKSSGNTFQAAWNGEKSPSGKSPRLAALTPTREMFEGSWRSLSDNSSHEVVMVAITDDGEKNERFIGTYKVDSAPPGGVLTVKGKRIGGIPSFSDEIAIFFRLDEGEPLSRWKIVILDNSGNPITEYDGKETICNGSVTWNGSTDKGGRAPAGIYAVSLQAWDRAGNFSQTTETVRYVPRPTPPDVSLKAEADGTATITLTPEGDIPLKFWSLQLWNKNNDLLLETFGETLPGTVTLRGGIGSLADGEVLCRVAATDLLGNRIVNDIKNLNQLAAGSQQPAKTPSSDAWIEDF